QEFRAKTVQELMKKHDVIYSPTQNETKVRTSGRAIQTIKTRIMNYLNYKDNYTYLPILDNIVESYNQTFHRTIGMRPIDVKETNQEEDMQQEEIKDSFYESELQKVDIDPNQTWKIEKILNSRGKGRNKQLYVKWKSFPPKFKSWIKASDFN
ncbi:uncharacterized protein LOC132731987, partial [Ruditapes philippinarum]|uniref:uncharacterized protein LOC132731987 n=1 Tax=Ruditapes philippinarum TaxID=129788 RepID=UPI00295A795E